VVALSVADLEMIPVGCEEMVASARFCGHSAAGGYSAWARKLRSPPSPATGPSPLLNLAELLAAGLAKATWVSSVGAGIEPSDRP
jgi:hypothetical protein